MNHWEGLTRFLQDVCIPLTNNEAERTIRHSVIGRKNFYGSRTINGADVTATLYTVIESCKKAQLDPKNYILMAVKKKPLERSTSPHPYNRPEISGSRPSKNLAYGLRLTAE